MYRFQLEWRCYRSPAVQVKRGHLRNCLGVIFRQSTCFQPDPHLYHWVYLVVPKLWWWWWWPGGRVGEAVVRNELLHLGSPPTFWYLSLLRSCSPKAMPVFPSSSPPLYFLRIFLESLSLIICFGGSKSPSSVLKGREGKGSYHKYETQKPAFPDLLSPPSKDTMVWGIEGMVEVHRAGYSHDLTTGARAWIRLLVAYWWFFLAVWGVLSTSTHQLWALITIPGQEGKIAYNDLLCKWIQMSFKFPIVGHLGSLHFKKNLCIYFWLG